MKFEKDLKSVIRENRNINIDEVLNIYNIRNPCLINK